MENNDSPYIYEKPLRSELRQRSKRVASLSALGLVGMVGIFGGSAIANTVVSSARAETTNEAELVDVVGTQNVVAAVNADPAVSAASLQETEEDSAPVISVPLQEAKPKSSAPKIELPALPTQNFGNTSSATPSVGSGAYASGSASTTYETRGERHERSEASDDNDDNENENENEND